MSIQRKDNKIKLSWQLENPNRYQIESLVHISNTIIIIALFTKSFETMTLMYSSKTEDDKSCDKTTTSRARYSRNNSSDDDNLHTDLYKQGKQQPNVALRGDERQEQMCTEKMMHDLNKRLNSLSAKSILTGEKLVAMHSIST